MGIETVMNPHGSVCIIISHITQCYSAVLYIDTQTVAIHNKEQNMHLTRRRMVCGITGMYGRFRGFVHGFDNSIGFSQVFLRIL